MSIYFNLSNRYKRYRDFIIIIIIIIIIISSSSSSINISDNKKIEVQKPKSYKEAMERTN